MMKTSPCQAQALVFVSYSSSSCTEPVVNLYHTRADEELNPGQKGLRDRNSPTCTLSQNGYGDSSILELLYGPSHGQTDSMWQDLIMNVT